MAYMQIYKCYLFHISPIQMYLIKTETPLCYALKNPKMQLQEFHHCEHQVKLTL